MKKKWLVLICLALVLPALLFTTACTTTEPSPSPTSEPIELSAVSFLPDYVEGVDAFLMLIDTINERADGELIIDYLGKGEVIGELEQGPAVEKGIVDIAWLPGSYYEGIVPGAKAVAYSQFTAAEMRETRHMN